MDLLLCTHFKCLSVFNSLESLMRTLCRYFGQLNQIRIMILLQSEHELLKAQACTAPLDPPTTNCLFLLSVNPANRSPMANCLQILSLNLAQSFTDSQSRTCANANHCNLLRWNYWAGPCSLLSLGPNIGQPICWSHISFQVALHCELLTVSD